MSRAVLLILCVFALAAGCGERQPAAVPGAADAGVPSPRGPIAVPTAPAGVVVADTGDEAAALNQLSAELRKYVVRTRSAPASFEDFVAKARVQAPPAPPGKKYALANGAVVLVKK